MESCPDYSVDQVERNLYLTLLNSSMNITEFNEPASDFKRLKSVTSYAWRTTINVLGKSVLMPAVKHQYFHLLTVYACNVVQK